VRQTLDVFSTQKVVTTNVAQSTEVDQTKIIFIAYDEKVVASGKLTAATSFGMCGVNEMHSISPETRRDSAVMGAQFATRDTETSSGPLQTV
jgi:hypothetical protein